MRLVDDRSRILGLVNPIDALVVLAVLVAIGVFGVLLFGTPGEEAAQSATVEFDLLVPRVEVFDPESVSPGDIVNETTGGELGTVVSVTEAAASLDVLKDGGLVWYESTTLKNVRIRVRAEATVTDQGYTVRGVTIRENAIVNVWTTGFEAPKAYITDVEVVQ